LSKLFEENRRGTLAELAAHYTNHPPKGEIVISVAGNSGEEPENAEVEFPEE